MMFERIKEILYKNKKDKDTDLFYNHSVRDVLLGTDSLKNKCTEIDKKIKGNKLFTLSGTILLSIVCCLIGLSLSDTDILSRMMGYLTMDDINVLQFISAIIFFSLIFICFMLLISTIVLLFRYRKTIDIYDELCGFAKTKNQYTAILVIVQKKKYPYVEDNIRKFKSVNLFLIGNSSDNDKSNYLPYVSLNANQTLERQKSKINNYLYNNYHIKEKNIINLSIINQIPYYGIKKNADDYKQHGYIFYNVIFDYSVKKDFQSNNQLKWMSIEDMRKNAEAVSANKDVIELLPKGDIMISDSFYREEGVLDIIWNITKECHYNCAICATHDQNRNECNFADKHRILLNLSKCRDSINHIDFAGGDPLLSDESIAIIQNASDLFGNSKISITTTGKGIEYRSKSKQKMLSYNYEITIDIESESQNENSEACRNENNYTIHNICQFIDELYFVNRITINMPIISPNVSDKAVNNIIVHLESIRNCSSELEIMVKFIRLMPVGKVCNNYPNDYDPEPIIRRLVNRFNESNLNIKYSLHCSLKTISSICEEPKNCGMLKRKIGIDSSGNVFACAWAGYLSDYESRSMFDNVEDNPFYLGNLVINSLDEILSENNEKYQKIINRLNHEDLYFCPVVAYYNSSKWFKNNDPLSTKENPLSPIIRSPITER